MVGSDYYRWILKWNGQDNRIGDLAREIKADSDFPENGLFQEMIDYLESKSDDDQFRETIKKSISLYIRR